MASPIICPLNVPLLTGSRRPAIKDDPCLCCGGEGPPTDANCGEVADYCCGDSPMPSTLAVTWPTLPGGCDCAGGPGFLEGAETLDKVDEGYDIGSQNCFVDYRREINDNCGAAYHDSYIRLQHLCNTGKTYVSIYQNANGNGMLWCNEYDDPDGSLYCAQSFEISTELYDDTITGGCLDFPGSVSYQDTCRGGSVLIG